MTRGRGFCHADKGTHDMTDKHDKGTGVLSRERCVLVTLVALVARGRGFCLASVVSHSFVF